MKYALILVLPFFLFSTACAGLDHRIAPPPAEGRTVTATYVPTRGLGPEEGVMRRDPSDVIKVGDLFYVWYTKGAEFHGYNATIWYATSADGTNWTEQGEALARGEAGEWDDRSVFTPNILVAEGKYWLFFTAVANPFNNNERNGKPLTKAGIGIAHADSPEGPWTKLDSNPALAPSDVPDDVDSLRIDDACLVVRNRAYWCYYKARQLGRSAGQTKLCIAIAEQPGGPYIKYENNPVIAGNHEVLVWPNGQGVSAMIGTTGPEELKRTVLYSDDGLDFHKTHDVIDVPHGAGAYRPEAFTDSGRGGLPNWGVHIVRGRNQGVLPYIQRVNFSEGP